MSDIKYPNIRVKLVGKDGNAHNLLGIVMYELMLNDVPHQEIGEFIIEATTDDYDHLLRTCMKWVYVY